MTLDEYYKKVFTTYYMEFDNKGNFKETKGLCPLSIIKNVEKEIKKHITKRRKNNMYVEVLYNNEHKRVTSINVIRECQYNRITGWENL